MEQNFSTISASLNQKEISSVELLERYLEKIDKLNPKFGAFIDVEREPALQDAQASDERRKKGQSLSEYDGIPIGIKDNIVQEGRLTGCASKILEGYRSPFTATVVEKLKRKGFIPIGRLNMDEFAMGSSTENSAIQTTRNPFDADASPGGSSGGSACAVSADMLPAALGSDTGGSIRQPASFCGVVGLKPTYGTVSRYGLVAFGSSLDQIGPITRTVSDSEIIYQYIKGHDSYDSTSISDDLLKKTATDTQNIRIGFPPDLVERCHGNVKSSFYKVLKFLKEELLDEDNVVEIEMPYQEYAIPSYYITATSEASSNLARFDGIRYGRRIEGENLEEVYLNSKTRGFGKEVKRRILLGTFALSSGYYDAYYAKAQKIRALMQQGYEKLFKKVNFILLPTTPTEPFLLGEKIDDPIQMYLSDELTVTASLAGIPSISIPAPFDRLPIGLQIQGPVFSEDSIFSFAKKIEEKFPAKVSDIK